MVAPVKSEGVVASGRAAEASGEREERRRIRLTFAGWLPHDLSPSGAASFSASGVGDFAGPQFRVEDSPSGRIRSPHASAARPCYTAGCSVRAMANTKAASSRATATTTLFLFFPRPLSLRKR